MPENIHELLTQRSAGRNLFESGKVFELRKVVRVADLPRRGVSVGDCALHDTEETSSFSDPRLTSHDIQPGDIVRLEQMGPSVARVTEVYREGLRIFPARKTHREQLEQHAAFRKKLHSPPDSGVNPESTE